MDQSTPKIKKDPLIARLKSNKLDSIETVVSFCCGLILLPSVTVDLLAPHIFSSLWLLILALPLVINTFTCFVVSDPLGLIKCNPIFYRAFQIQGLLTIAIIFLAMDASFRDFSFIPKFLTAHFNIFPLLTGLIIIFCMVCSFIRIKKISLLKITISLEDSKKFRHFLIYLKYITLKFDPIFLGIILVINCVSIFALPLQICLIAISACVFLRGLLSIIRTDYINNKINPSHTQPPIEKIYSQSKETNELKENNNIETQYITKSPKFEAKTPLPIVHPSSIKMLYL